MSPKLPNIRYPDQSVFYIMWSQARQLLKIDANITYAISWKVAFKTVHARLTTLIPISIATTSMTHHASPLDMFIQKQNKTMKMMKQNI